MLLERSAPAFCQAVGVLAANPGRNVLFHCRLGKDRTGVVSAVLLKLFGVSDSDVITDYMYSSAFEAQARGRLAKVGIAPPENESRVAREPTSPQAIEALLTALRERHGGARQCLEGGGVPDSRWVRR